MQYTDRYQLKKPETADDVSIGDINDNMDSIDEVLGKVPQGDGLPGQVIMATEDGVSWSGMTRWELVAELVFDGNTQQIAIPAGISMQNASKIMFIPEFETTSNYHFNFGYNASSSSTGRSLNCGLHNIVFSTLYLDPSSKRAYLTSARTDQYGAYFLLSTDCTTTVTAQDSSVYISGMVAGTIKIYLERMISE